MPVRARPIASRGSRSVIERGTNWRVCTTPAIGWYVSIPSDRRWRPDCRRRSWWIVRSFNRFWSSTVCRRGRCASRRGFNRTKIWGTAGASRRYSRTGPRRTPTPSSAPTASGVKSANASTNWETAPADSPRAERREGRWTTPRRGNSPAIPSKSPPRPIAATAVSRATPPSRPTGPATSRTCRIKFYWERRSISSRPTEEANVSSGSRSFANRREGSTKFPPPKIPRRNSPASARNSRAREPAIRTATSGTNSLWN
mmetsp:Transcript_29013/g.85839  ORF Transcript_29013/g.85839 Transcript_29013/m.85839 type:complete len:257 (-) Transcript_29013:543-1313(-)